MSSKKIKTLETELNDFYRKVVLVFKKDKKSSSSDVRRQFETLTFHGSLSVLFIYLFLSSNELNGT